MADIGEKEKLKGIDDLIQIYSEEINFDKQQFDLLRDEHLAIIFNWRQYILAAVGFAATFFVSLAQIDPVKSHLVQLLLITIPFGLGTFFILSAFRSSASIMLGRIDEVYLQMISNLYYIRAYVAGLSLQPDNYDDNTQQTQQHKDKTDKINFLGGYVSIVYGNRVALWYAYRQASKSIWFWQMKKILDQKAALQIATVYSAVDVYNQIPKPQITKMESLPDKLKSLSESLQYLSICIKDIKIIYNESQANKHEFITRLEQKKIDLSTSVKRQALHFRELELLNELILLYIPKDTY